MIEAGVDRDDLAGLDQDLDHRDVLEVADVGHLDFDLLAMLRPPSQNSTRRKSASTLAK